MPVVMTITVNAQDRAALQRKLQSSLFWEPLDRMLELSGVALEALAKGKVPVDKADLQRSIAHAPAGAHGMHIGTSLGYAPYVHGWFDDTRARSTPNPAAPVGLGSPLGDWARRKGIPPAFVARGIAAKGTPLVPFLRQALTEGLPIVEAFVRQAGEEIRARWGSM